MVFTRNDPCLYFCIWHKSKKLTKSNAINLNFTTSQQHRNERKFSTDGCWMNLLLVLLWVQFLIPSHSAKWMQSKCLQGNYSVYEEQIWPCLNQEN
ncbi:hypothetical protein T11_10774 [Trichinella zimbabwensis]|uniref:Uncharacterized protein n=1 Tax=Trichinella zimbabwensis TaxID=268475 RepID=A0A0V1I2N3_9BILA|nr:hypothetical protein T11_10774 [Trichinella zimbabwensis]